MNEIEKVNIYLDKTTSNCEKMKEKFKEGTSQHSLLRNRIKALEIGKACINGNLPYTKEEVRDALLPIESIMHKLTVAQSKYKENNTQYKRFQSMIDNILIVKNCIEKQIKEKRPTN